MNIDPAELPQNGYVELAKLNHQELIPFVRKYIMTRTTVSVIFFLANALCIGLVGYFFTIDIDDPAYHIGDRFTRFSNGLALAFALIPIHEYIHGVAYRLQGARNTSYAANLRQLYFMALADNFVANKREFQVIALAPFVVISSTLILLLFAAGGKWSLTIAGILFTHTAMCSGDFGLLSYFAFHKDKDIVTYDDVSSGVSYFYGKARDGSRS